MKKMIPFLLSMWMFTGTCFMAKKPPKYIKETYPRAFSLSPELINRMIADIQTQNPQPTPQQIPQRDMTTEQDDLLRQALELSKTQPQPQPPQRVTREEKERLRQRINLLKQLSAPSDEATKRAESQEFLEKMHGVQREIREVSPPKGLPTFPRRRKRGLMTKKRQAKRMKHAKIMKKDLGEIEKLKHALRKHTLTNGLDTKFEKMTFEMSPRYLREKYKSFNVYYKNKLILSAPVSHIDYESKKVYTMRGFLWGGYGESLGVTYLGGRPVKEKNIFFWDFGKDSDINKVKELVDGLTAGELIYELKPKL